MAASATGVRMRRKDRETTRDQEFADYMAARQPALLRTAFLVTGDPHTAEDVVQTALAKLYLAWDRIRDRNTLDAYVRKIIVNESHSLFRRPWKKREYAAAELPERDVTDGPEVLDPGLADEVWRVVATLPPRQRAVIVLRYYEELSEAEIADTLGISPGTVKSQASRALATLRTSGAADGLRLAPHREEES